MGAELDAIPGFRETFERAYPDHAASIAVIKSVTAVRRLESSNWDGGSDG